MVHDLDECLSLKKATQLVTLHAPHSSPTTRKMSQCMRTAPGVQPLAITIKNNKSHNGTHQISAVKLQAYWYGDYLCVRSQNHHPRGDRVEQLRHAPGLLHHSHCRFAHHQDHRSGSGNSSTLKQQRSGIAVHKITGLIDCPKTVLGIIDGS